MIGFLRLAACVLVSGSCAAATRTIPLAEGWKFQCGVLKGEDRAFTPDRMADWLDDMGRDLMSDPGPSRRPAEDPQHPFAAPDFDDRGWRTVRVPHDWSVESSFDASFPFQDGCLDIADTGWYRRRLDIPAAARGQRVEFACDGAMSHAMVWCNGRFAGGWPYGYTPWRVDLTPYLVFGGTNTLAIRVAHLKDSARFFTGAGLQRPCALVFSSEDAVVPGSVCITTPVVTRARAEVRVRWRRARSGPQEKRFTVEKPRLWDVDDPFLYTVDVDGETYRYGIRMIAFHADARGFRLNGRTVPLRGVCLHQELDLLGGVWNRRAWERRLRKLQALGANALRMSHYRHPAGLYDLCDEMGILVFDEFFDQWNRPFNPNDYHRLFARWHERDLRAALRADRNHPCVILWGLGNEIVEQRTDCGQYEPELFRRTGVELARIAREEDPTRPVATANNNAAISRLAASDFTDVYGFNYCPAEFARYRTDHPAKPFFSSETGCYLASRGEYFFPPDGAWRFTDFHSSSHLLTSICTMDAEWTSHDAVTGHAGGFYWTGFDYLGGPATTKDARLLPRSADPARLAEMKRELARYGRIRGSMRACATGMFDLAGFEKDVAAQFRARWRPETPYVHVMPHWNWPERVGEKTRVTAFSAADEVELFLNGVSQGRRAAQGGGCRFTWPDVTYAPGALKAVAYKGGRVWAEATVETTGVPARLAAEAGNATLAADGEDVAYVDCTVLDAAGRTVPRTRLPVTVRVEGPGELVGLENGDEADMTWFRSPVRNAFNGRLSAVVRAKKDARGNLTVVFTAEGLAPARAVVRIASGEWIFGSFFAKIRGVHDRRKSHIPQGRRGGRRRAHQCRKIHDREPSRR